MRVGALVLAVLTLMAVSAGIADATDEAIYLAIALRNVGTGLAVLDRWDFHTEEDIARLPHREPDVFQRFAHDVRFQKIEIDGEVRNLGHAAPMIRQRPCLQAQLRSAYDWRAVRVVAEPRHSHESRALHSGSWTHG